MEANHTSVNTVKWLSQALWYLQMSDMNTGALSVRVAVLQIHIAPSWQTVCCTWQLGSFEARMKTAAGGGRGTSCLDIFCFSQQKPVRKQLDAWEKNNYIYIIITQSLQLAFINCWKADPLTIFMLIDLALIYIKLI